ncbi:MAG: lytic murein transglycosylase [Elusimicrobiota bacterium]
MSSLSLKNRTVPFFIVVVFCFVIIQGCVSHKNISPQGITLKNTFDCEEKKELYQSLRKDIRNPVIKELLLDPRFKLYQTKRKKENYDKVDRNYFKSAKFGLLTDAGKARGEEFIRGNWIYLKEAMERFNLDEDVIPVISGLAGIEFSWGRTKTPYKAFNSLVSVYKYMPKYKNYALSNLRGLIKGIENPKIELDPYAPSSFMGAIGYCQLMPFWLTKISELNCEQELDIDSDGKFDIYNMADAIGFFAWYLEKGNFSINKRGAIRSYIGRGPTAEAYTDAILAFSKTLDKKNYYSMN